VFHVFNLDVVTIIALAVSVTVTAIILAITIYQFVRYRRNEKKKLEEEQKIKERRGLQHMSRDVPYRLGSVNHAYTLYIPNVII